MIGQKIVRMMKYRKNILALMAVLAPLAVLRAQSESSSACDTLAVIGSRVITAAEFAGRYQEKLLSVGFNDNPSARVGYLTNLVDDEILLAHGRAAGFDRTPDAQTERTRVLAQELVNAYIDRHISPDVRVDDAGLRQLFVNLQTRIRVRHLYSRTLARAESLYVALSSGKTFEELAQSVFADPQLRKSGGSLGFISVDDMDPAFEKAAYALEVGQISRPVKTAQGYSIIRVDEIQRDPLVTESAFQAAKDKLQRFARKRKYDETLCEFTARFRVEIQLRFNKPVIDRLYRQFTEGSNVGSYESEMATIPSALLQKTAVTWTGGQWKVTDVVRALSVTPERERHWIRTNENWEDFIAGMVMRDSIVRAARREKLDTSPAYRRGVSDAFDTYLVSAVESSLKSNLGINADSIRAYYMSHKEAFANPPEVRLSGILLETAAMADSVLGLLKKGEPFDDLARGYSRQAATAERGGDLGFFRKDALGKLGDDAFRLAVGGWQGPLQDQGKYLFLRCTARKGITYRSLEECSGEIEQMLMLLRWSGARRHFVDSFKQTIACRVYPDRVASLSLHSINR